MFENVLALQWMVGILGFSLVTWLVVTVAVLFRSVRS